MSSEINDQFLCRFQYAIAKHLCERVQRGMDFLDLEEMWPETPDPEFQKTLVVSGGVASNQMIRKSLTKICDAYGFRALFPPTKYCTDNGVMIAWSGLEKFRRGIDIVQPEDVFDAIDVETRTQLGVNISERVLERQIKCKWIKII